MQRSALFLPSRYSRILRFLVAGGSAGAVDLGVLYVFVHLFGMWYLLSSVIAFLVALSVSFTLQKFWTFKDPSVTGIHLQIFQYAVLAGVDLLINTASMFLLVEFAGFRDLVLLAQILTAGGIAVGNYFVYRHIIFRDTRSEVSPIQTNSTSTTIPASDKANQ
jgi:putative flippase GtrA